MVVQRLRNRPSEEDIDPSVQILAKPRWKWQGLGQAVPEVGPRLDPLPAEINDKSIAA
jgi:hypothetical protein